MAVSPFTPGDLFTYRIIKHHSANPERQWANTYEFRASLEGDEAAHLALIDALVEFEKAISVTTTRFDRATVSTWEPDSKPYDPEAFISDPLSDSGSVVAPSDALALNVCVSIARATIHGRFGHLFVRNSLLEGDVAAPAGKFVLSDPGAKQASIDTALEDSGLINYIGLGVGTPLTMVMIGSVSTQVRDVIGLVVQGVSVVPFNHTWFNRTSP